MLRSVASDRGAVGVPYIPAGGQGSGASVTGTTAETALATITIPGRSLGANGVIRVTVISIHTNNANTKTIRLRWGGIGGTSMCAQSATTSATGSYMFAIHNDNSASAQVGYIPTGFGVSSGAVSTASLDTASDQSLVISGTLANSADSIDLARYIVEIIPF